MPKYPLFSTVQPQYASVSLEILLMKFVLLGTSPFLEDRYTPRAVNDLCAIKHFIALFEEKTHARKNKFELQATQGHQI